MALLRTVALVLAAALGGVGRASAQASPAPEAASEAAGPRLTLRAFSSDASVKAFVAGNEEAIGYIDAVLLDDTVKVLSIDGKRPGEPGYALARSVN